MLSLLHIENIALIESADISFENGLNVLTGETGAGKSIVLDSISAVMGERTSRDLIRTGEKSALVSGVFTDVPQLSWFEENGIGPDENGELIITRQILADGKNVCRVGGVPCTVVQLRALGRQLINIHGQHDSQQLLDEHSHLAYLDSFGELAEMLEGYQKTYNRLQKIQREMDSLTMDEAEKSRRIDTLEFQIKELERANLQPGEEEDLTARRTVLRNSGKLMEAVEQAYIALLGDDEGMLGAIALLSDAQGAMESVSRLSSDTETVAASLAEIRFTADDLAHQIRSMREQFDVSPGELDQVESRLDVLYRLKKKYGSTTEEMLEYLSRCQEELDNIQLSDDALQRLEAEQKKLLDKALTEAKALSAARQKAGEGLKKRIEEELRQLDMPKVQFAVELAEKSGEIPLDATGMDNVQFLMSANLGESLKPIQKVASGGELSRIMLAMKNVLTENDTVATLIFDEVDAGVSGRAAQKVAEKMSDLGRHRQVLCVTHLPQIAAMADIQFSVQKQERQGRTHTQVEILQQEARVSEIARLTGGVHISEAILQGAKELVQQAENYKNDSSAKT